ncbi:hypothetical protein BIU82_10775 [Arthrobacter sp. SW1]|nr:hypothetical protein BIU82_10775 [Arthrobacter sp. SW1]
MFHLCRVFPVWVVWWIPLWVFRLVCWIPSVGLFLVFRACRVARPVPLVSRLCLACRVFRVCPVAPLALRVFRLCRVFLVWVVWWIRLWVFRLVCWIPWVVWFRAFLACLAVIPALRVPLVFRLCLGFRV